MNATNTWILSQFSKGAFFVHQHARPFTFKSTVGANYTSALAVRGFLKQTVLRPADYLGAFLVNRRVRPELQVWFKTEQPVGLHGYVVVDAPGEMLATAVLESYPANRTGFFFDTVAKECDARDLPPQYYALRPKEDLTYPLPGGIESCLYEPVPHNRARIRFKGFMGADVRYGFQVRAVSPYKFHPSQLKSWKIFTQDADQQYIDGNYDAVFLDEPGTVGFTEDLGTQNISHLSSTSWGIFQRDLNTPEERRCDIWVNNLLPFAQSNVLSELTFFVRNLGINLAATKLRIVAPFGWEWAPATKFAYKRTGTTAEKYVDPPTVSRFCNGNSENGFVTHLIMCLFRSRVSFRSLA